MVETQARCVEGPMKRGKCEKWQELKRKEFQIPNAKRGKKIIARAKAGKRKGRISSRRDRERFVPLN